ncbi:alcohol oxidase [Dichomitus squalens]|nr:alcohol oxidase [Dichomitus squalens]
MMTPDQFCSQDMRFDYVVVGGGTAGLVVASRLSEDPEVRVGVLEAGEWHRDVEAVTVPGLTGTTLGDPNYDWRFTSVPQKYSNGRRVPQPRGKGLGGSSLINFTGLNRASAREYDAIQDLGNPGWNWQEMLKYMKKGERTQPPLEERQATAESHLLVDPDPRWHGTSGPLAKGYSTYFPALHVPIVDALESLGVKKNFEPNDGTSTVGSHTIFSSVDPQTATRSHSSATYYEPCKDRPNLKVLPGSLASRIRFRQGSHPLVAEGVEFLNAGKQYLVSAEREVILCAGAFQSPQILELSGIGKKEVLSSCGIETLVDLPGVGENLQDHPYICTVYEIDDNIETIDAAAEPAWFTQQRKLYDEELKGYLSSNLSPLYAFLPSKAFASVEQVKRWKAQFQTCILDAPSGLKKQLAIQSKWFLEPDSPSAEGEVIPFNGYFVTPGLPIKMEPGKRYSSMLCAVMNPLSRGSVHITSSEPTAPPAIDPNCFSNALDLEMLLAVLKFAREVYETSPIRQHVVRRIMPTVEDYRTDDTLKEYIKNGLGCVYHPVGTAAMMPQNDGGVVDPELKVYGTKNLRVVDASILPMQIAAHTQATVYGIAEKGADIIKETYKQTLTSCLSS